MISKRKAKNFKSKANMDMKKRSDSDNAMLHDRRFPADSSSFFSKRSTVKKLPRLFVPPCVNRIKFFPGHFIVLF